MNTEAYKELSAAFEQRFACKPSLLARAPGRVNLLGEHIDYNGGIVLPAAIDREVRLVAAPTDDRIVTLYAIDIGQTVRFRLDGLAERKDLDGNPLPGWALYPAGIADALQKENLNVSGLQAVYASNVPMGSGLSSSAAVEVVFATTWRILGNWPKPYQDSMRIAQLCQQAENQYVGVACGLMDQFASACGVEGHLIYLDTRSLQWGPLPLPAGTSIVIADSGVRRTLAGSAYNERRAACEEAVHLLQKYKPTLRSLRDISSVEFAAFAPYLPEIPRKRAEHVVKEIWRVDSAMIALGRKDSPMFGGLMYAGHTSLRDLYEVSCKELDILVEATRNLPGCYGARLTGAGFGGCTVNLVAEDQAAAFVQGLHDEYQRQTGRDAAIYVCKASAGAEAVRIR